MYRIFKTNEFFVRGCGTCFVLRSKGWRKSASNSRGFRVIFSIFLFTCGLTATSAESLCQYAKRHWGPAPYLVSVVHEERFSKKEMVSLNLLRAAQRKGIVELEILDSESGESRIKRGDSKKPHLPYIVLRNPIESSVNPILSVPFSKRYIDMILTSPARVELGKRLCAGESAVFLLLDGKNSRENRSAEKLLNSELTRLMKRCDKRSHIRFSTLRVSRTRDERCLTAIILNSDPDLRKVDSPIVVPVFGRGRALPAFYGKGVNKYNISDAVETLTATCDVFLKFQAPGFDILSSTNWNIAMGVVRNNLSTKPVPLISMAVAARASDELEAVERENNDGVAENGRVERLGLTKKSPDSRVLTTSVVITSSLLLLIFAALIARTLQERANAGKSTPE